MCECECQREEITRIVAALIMTRTGRRIRGLIVSYCDDRMIVRGNAESYHVWQLAIAACQEYLADHAHVRIDCRLHVMNRSTARVHKTLQLA